MYAGMSAMGGDMGYGCIRGIVSCFCCLCCAGPILLIVGLVMLTGSNNYASMTEQYAAATKSFAAAARAEMLAAKGNVEGYSLAVSSTNTPFLSYTLPRGVEGVDDSVQSVVLESSQRFSSFPVTATIGSGAAAGVAGNSSTNSSDANTTAAPTAPPGSSSFQVQRVVRTSTRSISVRCPTSRNHGSCSASRMQSMCESAAGCSGATWNGFTCAEGRSCTGCTYTVAQSASCTPIVSKDNGRTFQQSDYTGCLYPFTGESSQPTKCVSSSSSSSSSMSVVFLNVDDPFIQFGKITSGSLSFGLTEGQQRSIGLSLSVVGGLVLAAVIGLGVFIHNKMCSREEDKARTYGAFGQTYNGVLYTPAAPPQSQNYMHVQSPQGVMIMPQQQQQPMYGQPVMQQPGYAPGYVQQQPAYGQVAYEQPQPQVAYVQMQPGYTEGPPQYYSPQGKAY